MNKFNPLSIYVATIALSSLPSVLAHGYISQVIANGQAYAGNVPGHYKGTHRLFLYPLDRLLTFNACICYCNQDLAPFGSWTTSVQ